MFILNSNLSWKKAGQVTGIDRLELPSHKELWVLILFQSKISIARTLYIANRTSLETDIFGVVNSEADYVHIFYHVSEIGMMSTSNPYGVVNFLMQVFYR